MSTTQIRKYHMTFTNERHPMSTQHIIYRRYRYKRVRAHARARTRHIGIDSGVAAKSMSENRSFLQWMEAPKRNHAHAEVHGSTRQLAWLDFRTCMVGLAQMHGSARASAWFSFFGCIQWQQKRLQPLRDPINHHANSKPHRSAYLPPE